MSKKQAKDKENSKLSKFKELWSNKRYKAMIKLGLYALFFASLFLISYISRACDNVTPNENISNEKTILDTYIENSYNYNHIIEQTKNGIDEIITYKGIETQASSSGTITYSNSENINKYMIDKVANLKYINGLEQNTIYENIDEKYFSLEKLKEMITKSTKQNNRYIYTDENNIPIYITIIEESKKIKIEIDFNEKYISETLNIKKVTSTYEIIE